MKRFLLLLTLLSLPLLGQAQETYSQEEFLRRYNNLAERVGPSGLGVETLLNKWEAAWPDDVHQLLARFAFYFDRSRQSSVIQLDRDRYLGREPLLPFADSLGNKKNYFEDFTFDDDLYAQANLAISKAIAAEPLRLDFRMARIDAMLAYEKEQPDMTLMELKYLADKQYKEHPAWEYEGIGSVSGEQFDALLQDYGVALFRLGSEAGQDAFRDFSQYLLTYRKDDPMLLNNLGSYYLVKKDFKKAAKYIDQVLKKHPDDMTALQNGLLQLMVQYGASETDKKSAQARLDAMNQKK